MVLNQTLGLNALRQDLNRLFYSAPIGQPTFQGAFYGQPQLVGQHAGFYAPVAGLQWNDRQHGHYVPKANWADAPEGTFLTIELPGVELSQVSLRIEGSYLVLEGIRHPGGLLGERMMHYTATEGRFGTFRWLCPIPNGTVAAGIEATFRNGLLHIMLPRVNAQVALSTPVGVAGPVGINTLAGATAMAQAPSAQVVINPGVNG